jgi:hypothetical protein
LIAALATIVFERAGRDAGGTKAGWRRFNVEWLFLRLGRFGRVHLAR